MSIVTTNPGLLIKKSAGDSDALQKIVDYFENTLQVSMKGTGSFKLVIHSVPADKVRGPSCNKRGDTAKKGQNRMKMKIHEDRTVILLVLLMMIAMVPQLISGTRQKVLTARPEVSTLAGMRSISKYADGTYKEHSAEGMKVGTAPDENRISVFKPSFTENVSLYKDWDVVDVSWQIAGTSAVMSAPQRYWSDTTPLDSLYEMNRTTMTEQYLIDMFDIQLKSGGNYSRTSGVYLWGDRPLPAANLVNPIFAVTIEVEDNREVDALYVAATSSGTRILSWKSSFRGQADIYVNNVRQVTDQFTVANRINRNTIWTDWMVSGSNEVYVVVKEPDDYTSTGTSNILTFTR